MSYQQYFSEVEAVVRILDEWIKTAEPDSFPVPLYDSEEFTALWQAVELLSRAYQVLMPLVAFDMNKVALLLPDVNDNQPRVPKLYGADGEPLA